MVGTVGGFGSSLFFVSIFQFLYDFQLVLALTGLLHVFSNTAKIILFWKTIEWKLTWWVGSSSVVLAIAGAYLTRLIDFEYARLTLGVFQMGFSAFFLLSPAFSIRATFKAALLGGGIAGFLAGFIGTGGAIRGLVLAAFRLEKNLFVGTSAAIDFGVDFSRTLIYLDSGYFGHAAWMYVPFLLIASFAGSYIGKRLLGKITEWNFRKVLLVLVFLAGLILVFEKMILLFD